MSSDTNGLHAFACTLMKVNYEDDKGINFFLLF